MLLCSLRQDNALGTLFNMVGFQTKLKYGAQTDVFRLIPGLEDASFARLGGLHRNTFLNSPSLLDQELRLKNAPHIRFAGQITGVEGYVESTTIGLMAGRFAAAQMQGRIIAAPPMTTAFGALLAHITINADAKSFQPMNVNFGLMPDVGALPAPVGDDGKTLARQAPHASQETSAPARFHQPRAFRFRKLARSRLNLSNLRPCRFM